MKKHFSLLLLAAILFHSQQSFAEATIASSRCAAGAFTTEALNPTGEPRLIILSAPSGGGKTTLAQLLLKKFPKLAVSVSSTTRAPRGQEKNGVDYHFLTKEEFQAKIQRGEFAEWAEVHGNYYGTDISNIETQQAAGNSVLALIDIKGAEKLREKFGDKVFTVFITPPNLTVLEARLRGRGTDPEAAIQTRLANARKEMDEAPNYDRVLVNDDLNTAFQELSDLLRPLIPE